MAIREKAAGALANIAAKSAANQAAIAEAGALPALIILAGDYANPTLRKKSLSALHNLAALSPANAREIKRAGVRLR